VAVYRVEAPWPNDGNKPNGKEDPPRAEVHIPQERDPGTVLIF